MSNAEKQPTERFGILISLFIGILGIVPATSNLFSFGLIRGSLFVLVFLWMLLIFIQIILHSKRLYRKSLLSIYYRMLDVCIISTALAFVLNLSVYGTFLILGAFT